MKRSKLLALSAITLLGFSACQKPELESELTSGVTHTVTFVAGAPETKTTATIDGTTVNYAWTEADEKRFTVYENGTKKATTVTAELGKEDVTKPMVVNRLGQLVKAEVVIKEIRKVGDRKVMCYAVAGTPTDVE